MATRTLDVNELQLRLTQLERKMSWLEAQLAQRGILSKPAPPAERHLPNEQLWAALLARGIIRAPSPAELALAAEWRALPEAERETTRTQLHELKLAPAASEIIHKMRDGWYPDETEWTSKS